MTSGTGMCFPVDEVTVYEDRHEISVACGGSEYLVTEADFLSMGISSTGTADPEALEFAASKLSCIKKSQRLLSLSDMSSSKLRSKLKGLFEENVIDAVVDLLRSKGYIDDTSLARRWANELAAGRRWGRMRIKSYLYEKGFASDDINPAVEAIDEEMLEENLGELIKASSGKYDITDRNSRAKLANSLYRYGYGWDEINHGLRTYIEECLAGYADNE